MTSLNIMDEQTNDLNATVEPKGAINERNGIIPPHVRVSSPGRPKGYNGLNARNPSSIALAFKKAGLDWRLDFAMAIKASDNYELAPALRARAKERVRLWLRLLPYLVTTGSRPRVKKWKGKASKAALVALEALEQGK